MQPVWAWNTTIWWEMFMRLYVPLATFGRIVVGKLPTFNALVALFAVPRKNAYEGYL